MTENENLIVQKCINIVKNEKVYVINSAPNWYGVRCDNDVVFVLGKNYDSKGGVKYTLVINFEEFKFTDRNIGLEKLHSLCTTKYTEQSKQMPNREIVALNFLSKFSKQR